MPFGTTTPDNRDYFEVSGDFSGTEDTDFEVKITLMSGARYYKWRSKVGDNDWGAYSSEASITVDTEYTLESGVKIKFTRKNNANEYNLDDQWTWTCYTDLELANIDGTYDFIETIAIDDKTHLVAINQTTGTVSVIEEIDGETPFLSLNTGLVGLGSSDSGAVLDFEKKNKELYIASGKGSAAKWLGYTKNQGWEGESGEYRLVAENALDVVSSSQSPQQESF